MPKNPLVMPILKWVGGKRQLLNIIRPLIPQHSRYYEPFIGGGAVFFDIQPRRANINDSNEELINLYRVIRDNPNELIEELNIHNNLNDEQYFYDIRSLDRVIEDYNGLTNIQKAARIIYLNKTCFNGLYRVNNAGQFNSPWGRYRNPNIVNQPTIRAVSRYLNSPHINITVGDYRNSLQGIRRGAFVYFDPPYMPVSDTSSFTGYTANGFGEIQQRELKGVCDELNRRNIKFLLSNSSCPFIHELYADYNIDIIPARRAINANADGRGAVDEVLVRNYGDN